MEFLARAKHGVTGILPYFVTLQPLRCVCLRSFGLSWVLRTVYLGPPREPGFNFQHLHVSSEQCTTQFHSIDALFWSVWAGTRHAGVPQTDLKSKHSYIELCFKKTNQHPGDLIYLYLGIVTERIFLSCWGWHCTQCHLVLLELRILMISTLCILCPYATPKYYGRKFEACLGYAACLLLLSLCVHTLLPVFRSKHWIHFILLILGNDI